MTCTLLNSSKKNVLSNLNKKAQIPQSKCSVLSPDKPELGCMNLDDKGILYSFLQCDMNDTNNINGEKCYKKELQRYKCQDEFCLLKKKYYDSKSPELLKIIKEKYKPLQPKKWTNCSVEGGNKHRCHFTWLSNVDIQNAIYHYQKKYSNFEFIGLFMIDFDKVQRDLQYRKINLFDIDFNDYTSRGINNLGIIFNTDKSTGSGIHWVSMRIFWDIQTKKGEINYFDSAGNQHSIPLSILKLMKTLQKKGEEQGYTFITQVNKKPHQKNNSECGVYSVFFIIYTLFNSLSDLNSHNIDDEIIHMFRDKLWIKQ